MSDFISNSLKAKQTTERKKVDKIVNGKVKTKKNTKFNTLKDIFISEDIANEKSYILLDVIAPHVKKAVSDIITTGVDMILYGGTRQNNRRNDIDRVSFRRYDKINDDHRGSYSSTRRGYSHDDIILDSRSEAEEVLTRMEELIATYGIVSVADLYDLVGVTCQYTDNKYGWTNIRSASYDRVRDGYILRLPKAMPID